MKPPLLPAVLPIRPFVRPVRGAVTLPGSKSLTNRALLLAALCEGTVALRGALFSEDTRIMAAALGRLGFAVAEDPARAELRVEGQGGRFGAGEAELFVGLAGTAARFLTALCAAAPSGIYRLDGVPQMRRRPMQGLIDALRSLGAEIRCPGAEGRFPLEIRARGLRGGRVEIDAGESSQMLSALLMVAPLAQTEVEIVLSRRVREPFVRMTTGLMARFGVDSAEVAPDGEADRSLDAANRLRVPKAAYRLDGPAQASAGAPPVFPIEPDATAASYFAALPLVAGGRLILRGLRPAGESLQGDGRFLEVLAHCGAQIEADSVPATDGDGKRGRKGKGETNAGGLTVSFAPGASESGRRRGVERDFSEFSDTFLTLAAIAPLLEGPTRITGIAHTRHQETDRVAGMARELERLGQRVAETEDSLEIHPQPLRPGQTIETYGDHRFAMSFGVLGCHDLGGDGRSWLSIRDPACCAKTFPNFFELLEQLRTRSSET